MDSNEPLNNNEIDYSFKSSLISPKVLENQSSEKNKILFNDNLNDYINNIVAINENESENNLSLSSHEQSIFPMDYQEGCYYEYDSEKKYSSSTQGQALSINQDETQMTFEDLNSGNESENKYSSSTQGQALSINQDETQMTMYSGNESENQCSSSTQGESYYQDDNHSMFQQLIQSENLSSPTTRGQTLTNNQYLELEELLLILDDSNKKQEKSEIINGEVSPENESENKFSSSTQSQDLPIEKEEKIETILEEISPYSSTQDQDLSIEKEQEIEIIYEHISPKNNFSSKTKGQVLLIKKEKCRKCEYVTTEDEFNPGELCRLCAMNEPPMTMIFGLQGIKLKLENKINRIIPNHVKIDDKFSTNICTNCLIDLKRSKYFTDKWKESETLFSVYSRYKKFISTKVNNKRVKCPLCPGTMHSLSGPPKDTVRPMNQTRAPQASILKKRGRPRKYPLAENLNVQFLQEQERLKKTLICEICAKELPDEETLDHHNRFAHENESIKCSVCQKEFSGISGLRNHMKTHIMERRYPCHRCDKRFMNRQTLREHLVVHLDYKPFQCKICSKHFARESRLKLHMLSHEIASQKNPQLLYFCTSCGQVFSKEELILSHLTGKEPGSTTCKPEPQSGKLPNYSFTSKQFLFIYRCEFCERCFKDRISLINHRKHHSGSKPFQCHICQASFETFSRCTTHKVTHGLFGLKSKSCTQSVSDNHFTNSFEIPRLFACLDCDKDYPHWTYLSVHRYTHTKNISSFKCDYTGCNEEFFNSWSLSFHRKTQHLYNKESNSLSSVRNKPYKCDICGRFYLNLENLKRHLKVYHSGETDHSLQCHECGKVFSKKATLRAHLRMHSGIKAYACTVCSKRFVHSAGLNTHLRMHRGERPHLCPYCGKTFLQRSDKDDHVRKHTGERPYACKDCPKKFRTRAMWLEHTRIHKDVRPFPCEICGAAFRRSFALKNHRLIHTGVRPFVCDSCGKDFRIRQDLIKHQRKVHKSNNSLPEFDTIDQEDINLDNNSLSMTPCVCKLCDQEFSNMNELYFHIQKNHEEIYSDDIPIRFEDGKDIENKKLK